MHILEDLNGSDTARALVAPGVCELKLACAAYGSGQDYVPAESYRIYGREGIQALRDICDQMLEADLEINPVEEGGDE